MYRLFSDSDCDITPEIADRYGYFILPMPFEIEGEMVYPYQGFREFDFHGFADKLRAGAMPTTSALNSAEYIRYFEPTFANGEDILYIHFSSQMSGTFKNMQPAVDELLKKYPERKFYSVDTLAISICALNMLYEAGEMKLNGATPEEIIAWVENERQHFATYFYADDLSFFRRSGRVNGLTALMGNILGLKPIIMMSKEGKLVSIGTERGKSRSNRRLLNYMESLGESVESHRVLVASCDAPEAAEELKALILGKYPGADVIIVPTNPTVVCHAGPGTVGVCFHAISR
ncbi:MAG: DegV family protein [Clostridia bacterium]|nr:DegV family protein [Clostridia bacterium]